MNLKPQDIVIALKLITLKNQPWTQTQVAYELCMSTSEVNAGLKRLIQAQLLTPPFKGKSSVPIRQALKEFLLHGIKYAFPPDIGNITRGTPTSYGATIIQAHIISGNDPIPVWPFAEGEEKGYAFSPLYKSVPKAIQRSGGANESNPLYILLVLVDTIRYAKLREKNIAETLLTKLLS